MRTSLQRTPSAPTSEEEMRKMREKAWHSQGCIVCFPEDVTDEWLRQGLINWANKQYGDRRTTS